MTVVAFSLARFTPADLSEFNEIARPRMDRGLWAGVSRQTSADGDQLLVTFPHLDRPVFRFERDRRGTYTLWFHDRQGWHSIGTGSILDRVPVDLAHEAGARCPGGAGARGVLSRSDIS